MNYPRHRDPRVARSKRVEIALAGLVAALACQAPEWQDFIARDASFRVQTPGALVETTDTTETSFGLVRSVRYLHSEDGGSFGVSYADYPRALVRRTNSKKLLDEARERALTSLDAKLVREQNIAFGPYAGRSLLLESAGGTITVQSRLILVGARLYHVVAVTDRDEADSPDVLRFLDSFQLWLP